MTEALKVTYSDIEVTYDEKDNVWRFELRGRQRSSESLSKAKDAIDAPAPTDKKPFTRIKAYIESYASGFNPCEVTSIAEFSYGSQQVWIVEGKDRSKKAAGNIVLDTPANVALIEEWRETHKQQNALEQKKRDLAKKMERLKVEKE